MYSDKNRMTCTTATPASYVCSFTFTYEFVWESVLKVLVWFMIPDQQFAMPLYLSYQTNHSQNNLQSFFEI